MKKLKLFWLIPLLAASMVSCSDEYDDKDLWNKVNSLDDRVTKIEAKLETLNFKITTLSQLMESLQKNLYITNVEKVSDGLIIYFSDRSHYKIYNGKDGQKSR